LVKHILKIFDENDNEISFNNLELKEEKRKFSSKCCKLLYIDNICITSKQRKSYKILYKCRCGRENKILLHKYINKDKLLFDQDIDVFIKNILDERDSLNN